MSRLLVVADTSPLNYLILIGQIEVLSRLYGEIFIPAAVFQELSASSSPPDVKHWSQNPPSWLKVRQVLQIPTSVRSAAIDLGEQEAITLALKLDADWLLIDDLDARCEAEAHQLRVTGTLGILLEASREKMIDLDASLAALQQTNFRASPSLIAAVRNLAAMRKP